MSIGESMIFRRALRQSMLILALVTAIFVTTQALNHADVIVANRDAAIAILYFSFLVTPSVVIVIIPIALLIGTIRTFETLQVDRELIALQAGGITVSRVSRPIALLSLLLAIFTLTLSVFVEPLFNRLSRESMNASLVAGLNKAAISHAFFKLNANTTIRVGSTTTTGQWGDIFIADHSESGIQKIFVARTGFLMHAPEGVFLFLQDGELLYKNNLDKFSSRTQFISNVFAVPIESSRNNEERTARREQTTSSLFTACAKKCSQSGGNSEIRELIRRVTDWLYLFPFAAIALWRSTGPATPMPPVTLNLLYALLPALALRGVGFLTLAQANQNLIWTSVPISIPIFGTLTPLFLLHLRSRIIPKPYKFPTRVWSAHISAAFEKIAAIRSAPPPVNKTGT